MNLQIKLIHFLFTDEVEEAEDGPISNSSRHDSRKINNKKLSEPKLDSGSGIFAQIVFVILLLALTVVLALIAIELHTNQAKGKFDFYCNLYFIFM